MKKIMSYGELECLVEQISVVLEDCPLYYVIEVLEGAKSYRDRQGEQDELDVSSDEEEKGLEYYLESFGGFDLNIMKIVPLEI